MGARAGATPPISLASRSSQLLRFLARSRLLSTTVHAQLGWNGSAEALQLRTFFGGAPPPLRAVRAAAAADLHVRGDSLMRGWPWRHAAFPMAGEHGGGRTTRLLNWERAEMRSFWGLLPSGGKPLAARVPSPPPAAAISASHAPPLSPPIDAAWKLWLLFLVLSVVVVAACEERARRMTAFKSRGS